MIPVGVEMRMTAADGIVAARHVHRRLVAGDAELMSSSELLSVAAAADSAASWSKQVADVCRAKAARREQP